MKYEETLYMEPRAYEFMCAWPKVPVHLQPAYSRLFGAGLIWVDPNVDLEEPITWPGGLRLTERGEALTAQFNDFGRVNFWPVEVALAFLTNEELANRDKTATKFLELFKTDWNMREVRKEIADRLNGVPPPPWSYPPRPKPKPLGLKGTLYQLELKLARNISLRK